MKTLKLHLSMGLILVLAFFAGCKKDKAKDTGGNATYKVKFVGTVSAGSSIKSVSIVYGVNVKSFTALSGTSWTQEMDLKEQELRSFSDNPTKNISFGVQADGVNASATGKAEIFVNGTSVKKAEGSGTVLSPNATYIFD